MDTTERLNWTEQYTALTYAFSYLEPVCCSKSQDNQNGVITHLEPDILEFEVKWALGSITTNKAKEVMEFQLSYFNS